MSQIGNDWLVGIACAGLGATVVLAIFLSRDRSGKLRRVALVQIVLLLVSIGTLVSLILREPATGVTNQETSPGWQLVGQGITEGISGLALIAADGNEASFIAVHDNKQPGEKRLSIVRRHGKDVEARPLAWTGEPLPVDLEAICRQPEAASMFLALTSRGAVYRFTLRGDAEVSFDPAPVGVPNSAEERQFESFDVQRVGTQTFACWAERGDKAALGVIFCSTFDPLTLTFGEPQPLEVRAPWPAEHTRHISDLRLLSDGTIVAASAADPGNDGPFSGAVYIAGTLQPTGDLPQLVTAQPSTRLFTTTTHKIEAIELVPGPEGGLLIGSDDENLGASVLFTW